MTVLSDRLPQFLKEVAPKIPVIFYTPDNPRLIGVVDNYGFEQRKLEEFRSEVDGFMHQNGLSAQYISRAKKDGYNFIICHG